MMLKKSIRLIFLYLALGVFAVMAYTAAQAEELTVRFTEQLQRLDPRLRVTSVEVTPLETIYRIWMNTGDQLYIHQEGEYIFVGSLLQITDQGIVDLTEQRQAQQRSEALASLMHETQVIFPAQGETLASIAVLTDITCPYCVRLHEQVPALNAAGVEVRYLAFPRQGLQTPGAQLLANVWCAEDRQQAMNRAKAGETLPVLRCDHPIAAHFEWAQAQRIQGTPAIILPNGQLIPGFVPAIRLIQELGLATP